MTTKHTAGKWEVHPRSETTVIGNGYSVASCGGHADNTRDAGELRDESRANAHLIAAAPELLQALEMALVVLATWDEKDRPQAITMAQSALLKARGEA